MQMVLPVGTDPARAAAGGAGSFRLEIAVAVGTTIADRPGADPYKTALTHTALALDEGRRSGHQCRVRAWGTSDRTSPSPLRSLAGTEEDLSPTRERKPPVPTSRETWSKRDRVRLAIHMLHLFYKLANRPLTLRAYIRESDSLPLGGCPHDDSRRVDDDSGNRELK